MDWQKNMGHTGSYIIPVSRESVDAAVERSSNVLGLPIPERKLSFHIPGRIYTWYAKAFMGDMAASYDPRRGRMLTPPKQHESVIFHESVHYVMHCNGMLFLNPVRKPLQYFYAGLLNETVSETATSSEYPYSEEALAEMHSLDRGKAEDMLEYFQTAPKDKVKEMERDIGSTRYQIEIDLRACLAEFIERDIEELFCAGEYAGYADQLKEHLYEIPLAQTNALLRRIAVKNAARLNSSGATPRDLVAEIAKNKQEDAMTAYMKSVTLLLG